jgi:hypothetical protein
MILLILTVPPFLTQQFARSSLKITMIPQQRNPDIESEFPIKRKNIEVASPIATQFYFYVPF